MLRSVVEGSNTSIFALIALVLFVASFAAIVIAVLVRKQKTIDRQARLPLDDEPDTQETQP